MQRNLYILRVYYVGEAADGGVIVQTFLHNDNQHSNAANAAIFLRFHENTTGCINGGLAVMSDGSWIDIYMVDGGEINKNVVKYKDGKTKRSNEQYNDVELHIVDKITGHFYGGLKQTFRWLSKPSRTLTPASKYF